MLIIMNLRSSMCTYMIQGIHDIRRYVIRTNVNEHFLCIHVYVRMYVHMSHDPYINGHHCQYCVHTYVCTIKGQHYMKTSIVCGFAHRINFTF